MRKLTSSVIAAAMVASWLPAGPSVAQTRATTVGIAPVEKPAEAAVLVAFTVKSFPSGGAPLKAAITDLIVKNPGIATSVALHVRHDRSMSPAQKEAVIAGLAAALNSMGIVAQAEGVDPLTLALIIGGAGAAGLGLYQATKNSDSATPVVSPN